MEKPSLSLLPYERRDKVRTFFGAEIGDRN
jgi:hypothetical protein